MTAAVVTPPSKWSAWALATRPKTLVAGVVPVAVGSAVAFRLGGFRAWPAVGALLGALLIQIGTNLINDYFDFKKGADTAARLGPPRATQQGWLKPEDVFRGALTCFGLAFVVGLYLVSVSGWPLLLVGLTSLAAGYAYTGGPFPLAYNGLGDVFVLVFFGFVAVCGTSYVHLGSVPLLAVWASVPVGLLGVGLLAVNNTRDRQTDASANKRTLVVRFGERFGRLEYVACVVAATAVPVMLWLTQQATPWVLAPLCSLPLALTPMRLVLTQRGAILNSALAATARFQLVFGVLLALGLSQ